MQHTPLSEFHDATGAQMSKAMADGAGLTEVLTILVHGVEAAHPWAAAGVLLVDVSGLRLKTGAAPGLPAAFNESVDGLVIGPGVGPWGAAVSERRRVVVHDLRTDALFAGYRDAAVDAGFVACWVEPIVGKDGVLGALTLYAKDSIEAAETDFASLEAAAALASVAIDQLRAEDALRISNQLLEASQSIAKVGGWELDLDSGRLFWTAETYRIHDTSPEEFNPTVDAGVGYFLPESRRRISDALQAAMERGEGYDLELETLTTKGRRIDVRTTCEVTSRDGRAVKLTGIFQDISEQKAAEASMRQTQQQLATAMSLANMADWEIDLVRGIFIFNDRIYELFGTNAEDEGGYEMSVETFLGELCHPDDAAFVLGRVSAETADPQPGTQQLEYRLVRRDTRAVRNMVVHYVVEADASQRGISGFGSVIDVTDRRQTALAHKQSETRLKAVIDSAMDAIIILDDMQRVILFNPAAEAMFGRRSADMLWQSLDCLIPEASRQGHSGSLAGMKNTTGSGRQMGASRGTITAVRGDGSEFPIEVSISKTLAGERPVFVAIARDLTAREAKEAERAALEAQLQQAQRLDSIGQLAGGVAHDFNNMLNVILISAKVALDGAPPGGDLRTDLLEILEAAERSAGLTRQLLAFSRQEAIVPRVLDLNEMVEGMLSMLRRLLGEELRMTWAPGANLRRVKMDPGQVDQLLVNLCVNARDAVAGVGIVEISTANTSLDAVQFLGDVAPISGDFVRLTVSDNGCGMDADTRGRIFEPFFTTKNIGQGTGLGLSTVFGIVKQNGGAIDVISEPGTGATFSIYLPCTEQPLTDLAGGGSSDAPVDGGETLLVVDDEPSMLVACKRVLMIRGYKVLAATSPQDALALAKEHSSSLRLLITDVVMPEMSGPELFAYLAPSVPGLECLYMSGYCYRARYPMSDRTGCVMPIAA